MFNYDPDSSRDSVLWDITNTEDKEIVREENGILLDRFVPVPGTGISVLARSLYRREVERGRETGIIYTSQSSNWEIVFPILHCGEFITAGVNDTFFTVHVQDGAPTEDIASILEAWGRSVYPRFAAMCTFYSDIFRRHGEERLVLPRFAREYFIYETYYWRREGEK
jgi:hypothetical protein